MRVSATSRHLLPEPKWLGREAVTVQFETRSSLESVFVVRAVVQYFVALQKKPRQSAGAARQKKRRAVPCFFLEPLHNLMLVRIPNTGHMV